MSAFVCDAFHHSFLAAAAVFFTRHGVRGGLKLTPEEIEAAKAIARDLHVENVASVNFRYNESSAETFDFDDRGVRAIDQHAGYPTARMIDNLIRDVADAADCLEYQSCEHPGWRSSRAARHLAELRAALLNRVLGDNRPRVWGADPARYGLA